MLTTKNLQTIRRAVKNLDTRSNSRRSKPTQSGAGYSIAELAEFRRLLVGMKQDSIKQVQVLRESSHAGIFDEQSAMLIQRELRLLAHIEGALMRHEEGTYGLCRSCGEFIERGRLEAVPHTQLCLECKAA